MSATYDQYTLDPDLYGDSYHQDAGIYYDIQSEESDGNQNILGNDETEDEGIDMSDISLFSALSKDELLVKVNDLQNEVKSAYEIIKLLNQQIKQLEVANANISRINKQLKRKSDKNDQYFSLNSALSGGSSITVNDYHPQVEVVSDSPKIEVINDKKQLKITNWISMSKVDKNIMKDTFDSEKSRRKINSDLQSVDNATRRLNSLLDSSNNIIDMTTSSYDDIKLIDSSDDEHVKLLDCDKKKDNKKLLPIDNDNDDWLFDCDKKKDNKKLLPIDNDNDDWLFDCDKKKDNKKLPPIDNDNDDWLFDSDDDLILQELTKNQKQKLKSSIDPYGDGTLESEKNPSVGKSSFKISIDSDNLGMLDDDKSSMVITDLVGKDNPQSDTIDTTE